jgi:hypothetical protein
MGHYVVFAFQQAELQAEYRNLKNKISNDNLIVFKVPVLLYHQADRELEPVEGQFEHKDTLFQMVKQRLQNDTLYVYCHKQKKTQIIHSDLAHNLKERLLDIKNHSGYPKNPLKKFVKKFVPFTDFAISMVSTSYTQEQQMIAAAVVIFSSIKPDIDAPPPQLG